jgi:hypothetical protein
VNILSACNLIRRTSCVAALALAAGLGQAQTRAPGLKVVPQPAAPSTSVSPAAPAAAGLGAPNPAGLSSQFPGGVPSPRDTPPGSPAIDAGIAAPSVMGAGAPAPRPPAAAAGGAYTPVQVAQSFLGADANRDGELSRAEAQRLAIAPLSFEEMDRNHDGVLTRFEYEDALR